jgi:hypothetical protein
MLENPVEVKPASAKGLELADCTLIFFSSELSIHYTSVLLQSTTFQGFPTGIAMSCEFGGK